MWIAAHVTVFERIMEKQMTVVAPKPIPEIIAHAALLRETGNWLERARVRDSSENRGHEY
jgi:hypothetical protein